MMIRRLGAALAAVAGGFPQPLIGGLGEPQIGRVTHDRDSVVARRRGGLAAGVPAADDTIRFALRHRPEGLVGFGLG